MHLGAQHARQRYVADGGQRQRRSQADREGVGQGGLTLHREDDAIADFEVSLGQALANAGCRSRRRCSDVGGLGRGLRILLQLLGARFELHAVRPQDRSRRLDAARGLCHDGAARNSEQDRGGGDRDTNVNHELPHSSVGIPGHGFLLSGADWSDINIVVSLPVGSSSRML